MPKDERNICAGMYSEGQALACTSIEGHKNPYVEKKETYEMQQMLMVYSTPLF